MKQFIWLSLVLITHIAQADPNYAKEKRWASQIEDSLLDGEAIIVAAKPKPFFSIYTESETTSNKAAILIHGIGAHPNWPQVILPLRVSLTTIGYHTLSIQMPVLTNGVAGERYIALFDDAKTRIQAAINHLEKQNLQVDLLVAHSLGTAMASHFLTKNQHTIKQFVAIGMSKHTVPYIRHIKIPVFDLYGTNDIQPVLDNAKNRAKAGRTNPKYQQRIVDADHFFNHKDDLLIKTVHQWIKP